MRAKYDARRAELYDLAQRYTTLQALIEEHAEAACWPGLPVKAARWHEAKVRSLGKQLRRSFRAAKEVG